MKDTNLIIGKKNTGKTRNILFNEVEKIINNNENILIYDDRDEYYKSFSKLVKDKGYDVLTLNLSDSSKSNGFNPLLVPYLLYKQNKLDESVNMINNLALEIFKEDGNHDPFWENTAANYFTGLVLILFKEAPLNTINIGSIQVMMNQGEEKYHDTNYLKEYLKKVDVTSPIYSLLAATVYAPSETKGSIISVSRQKLNTYLLREQLLNLLNTNDINLLELKDKTCIFIIGNDDISDITNIFINQLVTCSNKSFTYILDNLDTLRKVLCLNKLVRDASYKGNKVYVAFHSLDELFEKYGESIINQFENIVNVSNNSQNVLKDLGDDFDYPTLEMNQHDYFNFKLFMNSN